MATTIEVTAEDIAKGIPNQGCSCPIAIAARRALGREDIDVRYTRMCVGDGVAVLPSEARRFITLFDTGKPVKPFAFTID